MSTTYIKLLLDDGSICFQRVVDGYVVAYLDAAGVVLGVTLPAGVGSRVIDADPPREAWMD